MSRDRISGLFYLILLLTCGLSLLWSVFHITKLTLSILWRHRLCSPSNLWIFPVVSACLPLSAISFGIIFFVITSYIPTRLKKPKWRMNLPLWLQYRAPPVNPQKSLNMKAKGFSESSSPKWVPSRSTLPPLSDYFTSDSMNGLTDHELIIESRNFRRSLHPNHLNLGIYTNYAPRQPYKHEQLVRNITGKISLTIIWTCILAGFGWLIYGTVLVSKSDTAHCYGPLYKLALITVIVDWVVPFLVLWGIIYIFFPRH